MKIRLNIFLTIILFTAYVYIMTLGSQTTIINSEKRIVYLILAIIIGWGLLFNVIKIINSIIEKSIKWSEYVLYYLLITLMSIIPIVCNLVWCKVANLLIYKKCYWLVLIYNPDIKEETILWRIRWL